MEVILKTVQIKADDHGDEGGGGDVISSGGYFWQQVQESVGDLWHHRGLLFWKLYNAHCK